MDPDGRYVIYDNSCILYNVYIHLKNFINIFILPMRIHSLRTQQGTKTSYWKPLTHYVGREEQQ